MIKNNFQNVLIYIVTVVEKYDPHQWKFISIFVLQIFDKVKQNTFLNSDRINTPGWSEGYLYKQLIK